MGYGIGIIGYGWMGGWHREILRDNIPQEEIRIAGVFDIREEACQRAKEHGLKVHESREALLADPDVDIVLVTVPNDIHKEISIQAMRSGKHVICEKPVTLSSADLEEMIAVSKETGQVFTVHHNRRWDRDYMTVKEILAQKLIGEPYYIETRVQGARRNLHGWRGHKVNGGGILLDWGVHLIDQILMLIDSPVVSVDAHLLNVYNSEVDDNYKCFLRFENGVSVLIENSTNCFIRQPRWHISCTDGTAQIDNFECEGKIIKLISDEEMEWGDDIVYTAAGPTRTMAPRPKHTMEDIPLPQVDTSWANFYRNLIAALGGEAELAVRTEQVMRSMKLVEAIFQCQEQGHGMACHI